MDVPCGVPIIDQRFGAREVNRMGSSSGEKRTRTGYKSNGRSRRRISLPLYLYYRPRWTPPLSLFLTSFPDTCRRHRRAAPKWKVLTGGPSLSSSAAVISLFFSSSFSFLCLAWLKQPFTTRSEPPSLASSLRHCTRRVPSAVDPDCRLISCPSLQHLRYLFDAMLHVLRTVPSGSRVLQDIGAHPSPPPEELFSQSSPSIPSGGSAMVRDG